MNPLAASVVIPTRNRPQAIDSCLNALAGQTLPSGSFEVVVVDDGSETKFALDPVRWAGKFELKVIHQSNTGPAGARNRGVSEARGEFLAFIDDDCLPTPTWLETLVTALRKNPSAIVGGSTFNGLKHDLFAETSQLIVEMVYEHFNRNPANAYFFASNNFGCSRSAFKEIGGFDTEFPSAGAEDREFCDRWRMLDRPLVWEKASWIEHRHPQSLAAFCKIYWRYGQGAFLYQAKRKQRASGSMSEDMAFHRSLPKAAWQKIRRYRWSEQLTILTLLLFWQFMNAAGFLKALCRSKWRI